MIIRNERTSLSVSHPLLLNRRLKVDVYKPGGAICRRDSAELGLTGFTPDSIEEAEAYALAILEACTIARQLNIAYLQNEHGAGTVNNDYSAMKFEETGHDYPERDFRNPSAR